MSADSAKMFSAGGDVSFADRGGFFAFVKARNCLVSYDLCYRKSISDKKFFEETPPCPPQNKFWRG